MKKSEGQQIDEKIDEIMTSALNQYRDSMSVTEDAFSWKEFEPTINGETIAMTALVAVLKPLAEGLIESYLYQFDEAYQEAVDEAADDYWEDYDDGWQDYEDDDLDD